MTAETLGQLVPGFAEHWAKGVSLFIEPSGAFTVHGVFSECSHFVRDRFDALPQERVQALANFVSDCLEGKHGDDADNAAATCFLENLARERFHDALATALRPEARRFYDSV